MGFEGFGPRALPFFKALAFHQTKEWFEENRETYETAIRGPMGDLADEMAARLAKARIPIKGDRKSSLFRIHRDVRFSKNKDPYKTNAGVAMTRSGSKNDPGVLYFHLSPEECFFAAGFHMPGSQELARLRGAAVRTPKAFKQMMAKLAATKLTLRSEDALKRAPAVSRMSAIPTSRWRRGSNISSAFARFPRPRSASRRSSTTSAASQPIPCRCSNGAGTRSQMCVRARRVPMKSQNRSTL